MGRHHSGFIFDMDGTLLDSIHIWHEAEQRVMDDVGVELSKEERDELNALTLEEAGEWFHGRFGIMESGAEVVRAIVGHMLDFYRNEAEPNPGAVEFVRKVSESGARLCVLSSSPQAFLQAGLAHSGLKGFFDDDLIVSAEDAGMTKRSPETFARICELLGTEPANTWLFDDSWYALATAREAGMRCVGMFSTDSCGTHEELARYSDLVADDFTELDPSDFTEVGE